MKAKLPQNNLKSLTNETTYSAEKQQICHLKEMSVWCRATKKSMLVGDEESLDALGGDNTP